MLSVVVETNAGMVFWGLVCVSDMSGESGEWGAETGRFW